MKLHDLKKRAGTAMVWPPQWVESSGPGHTSAVAEEGMLEGLQRLDNRLLLQITINGGRRAASMEWDPLPAVGWSRPRAMQLRQCDVGDCGQVP
jgi:hypothetical protein